MNCRIGQSCFFKSLQPQLKKHYNRPAHGLQRKWKSEYFLSIYSRKKEIPSYTLLIRAIPDLPDVFPSPCYSPRADPKR